MRFVSDFQLNKIQSLLFHFSSHVGKFLQQFLFFQVFFSHYFLIYQFQIRFLLHKSLILQQFMVLFDFLERDCSIEHLLESLLGSNRLDIDREFQVVWNEEWRRINFGFLIWGYVLTLLDQLHHFYLVLHSHLVNLKIFSDLYGFLMFQSIGIFIIDLNLPADPLGPCSPIPGGPWKFEIVLEMINKLTVLY